MSDTGRIKEEFAALQRIIDSDPEGTLQQAAEAAREHDSEIIQLLAPVFEQWAFVTRFGDQILRTGGPETIAVARKLLGEEDQ